jgi:hypothetical protein
VTNDSQAAGEIPFPHSLRPSADRASNLTGRRWARTGGRRSPEDKLVVGGQESDSRADLRRDSNAGAAIEPEG